jgi:LAS superfamily LD-carboxypeptidase LdcB
VISVAKLKKHAVLTGATILLILGIQSCQTRSEDPGVAQYSDPPIAEQIAQTLPILPPEVAVAETPKPWSSPPLVAATPTTPSISSVITTPAPVQSSPSTTITAALAGKTPVKISNKSSAKSATSSYKLAINTNSSIALRYGDVAQQTGYVEQYPEIDSKELVEYHGQRLHKDAAMAFDRMQKAATKDQIKLQIISGFRGIKSQAEIFANKGDDLSAAAYSAPPGHSQHHTGLAIDLNSLKPSFRQSKEFAWLQKNASSYGFMLPYNNINGDLGPNNEPWHWVYVGKSPAMRLMASFLSRARQNNYDPLLGNSQLEAIYKAQTIAAAPQISRR